MLPLFLTRTWERGRKQHGFSLLEAIMVVAVTMVLAALTGKAMFSALNNYYIASTARNLAASSQVARIRATGRQAWYRVTVNTTGNSYRTETCIPNMTTTPPSCSAGWTLDSGTSDMTFGKGVTASIAGISTAAPNDTGGPNLATDMTWNSRGLLIDTSTDSTINNRCFYLQGSGTRNYAICTTMVGKTTIYRLDGSNWVVQ